VSNAPSKPVSFSRPKVGYFSNRPRKKRIYDTLHSMLRAESGTQEMRITHTDWSTVWKNVGEAPVSGTNKA